MRLVYEKPASRWGEALPLAFPAPGEVLRASPDFIPLDIARVIY